MALRFVNDKVWVPVCITDVVAVSPYSGNTSGERLLQRRRYSGIDVDTHGLQFWRESVVVGSYSDSVLTVGILHHCLCHANVIR